MTKTRLTEPDWEIHAIFDDEGGPTYHTHGMKARAAGQELELNLPLDGGDDLLNRLGLAIANGDLPAEELIDTSLFDTPVMLVRRPYGVAIRSDVLRLVLPDDEGHFPGDPGCDPMYENQLSSRAWPFDDGADDDFDDDEDGDY